MQVQHDLRNTALVDFRYPTIRLGKKLNTWLNQSRVLHMTSSEMSSEAELSRLDESEWENVPGVGTPNGSDAEDNRNLQSLFSGSHTTSTTSYDTDDNQARSVISAQLGNVISSDLGSSEQYIDFQDTFDTDYTYRVQSSPWIQAESTYGGFDHEELSGETFSTATLRQAVSTEPFQSDEVFNLLYIGSDAAKDVIVKKIAEALAVQLRYSMRSTQSLSSTYSVVPTSSIGDEVTLLPSVNIGMSIQKCTKAEIGQSALSGRQCIELTFDGGEIVRSYSNIPKDGTLWSQRDFKLPHLGIIFLTPTENDTVGQSQTVARNFLTQHDVPCIVVTSDTNSRPSVSSLYLDPRSPHFRIESRYTDDRRGKVVRKSPINLNTFLGINPVDMSRNLACLLNQNRTTGNDVGNGAYDGVMIRHSSISEVTRKSSPLRRLLNCKTSSFTGALFLVVSIFFCLLHDVKLGSTRTNGAPVSVTCGSNKVQSIQSQPNLETNSGSTASTLDTVAVDEIGIPGSSSSETILLVEPINTSKTFDVRVSKDRTLTVYTPDWMQSAFQASKLSFNVERQHRHVAFKQTPSQNGSHRLNIDVTEGNGPFNITIGLTGRSIIHERFLVDLDQANRRLRPISYGLPETVPSIKSLEKQFNSVVKSADRYSREAILKTATEARTVRDMALSAVGQHIVKCFAPTGSIHATLSHVQSQTIQAWRSCHFPLLNLTSTILTYKEIAMPNFEVGDWDLNFSSNLQRWRRHHMVDSQVWALRFWWKVQEAKSHVLPAPP
ncbi:hypothetical protein MMC25_007954 [Agyrium rufum]|nr:hypothetical protein [Agyrium rufum]